MEPGLRYEVELEPPQLLRFLRLRRDGRGALHFRQLAAYGAAGDDPAQRDAYAATGGGAGDPPAARSGKVIGVGGFDLFVDDAYGPRDLRGAAIAAAMKPASAR